MFALFVFAVVCLTFVPLFLIVVFVFFLKALQILFELCHLVDIYREHVELQDFVLAFAVVIGITLAP